MKTTYYKRPDSRKGMWHIGKMENHRPYAYINSKNKWFPVYLECGTRHDMRFFEWCSEISELEAFVEIL